MNEQGELKKNKKRSSSLIGNNKSITRFNYNHNYAVFIKTSYAQFIREITPCVYIQTDLTVY